MGDPDEPLCEQCEDTGVYNAGDSETGENWTLCQECVPAEPEAEADAPSYPDGVTGDD